MCIAPLIQSSNGYVEMLYANAFLATLTVFAFIKAYSSNTLKGTWEYSHVTNDVITLSLLE